MKCKTCELKNNRHRFDCPRRQLRNNLKFAQEVFRLNNLGMMKKDIAEKMGCSNSTIGKILMYDEFNLSTEKLGEINKIW